MWILVQTNQSGTRSKYIASKEYDDIISYIHSFNNVKKIRDYKWEASEGTIIFNIYLGEEIQSEKENKKKSHYEKITERIKRKTRKRN